MSDYKSECIFYLGLQILKMLEEKRKVWLIIDTYYDSIQMIYEDFKKYDNKNESLLDSVNGYIDLNKDFIMSLVENDIEETKEC